MGATDSTTRTHYYDQGETRHTGTGTPSKHCYTKDHLGTIHGITSGTGTVEASFRYDPYGLRTDILSGGSTPSDRGYTGHWYFKPSTAGHAAVKEMYLTWYGMYDPVHGRWLSRDPIGTKLVECQKGRDAVTQSRENDGRAIEGIWRLMENSLLILATMGVLGCSGSPEEDDGLVNLDTWVQRHGAIGLISRSENLTIAITKINVTYNLTGSDGKLGGIIF